MKAGILCGYPFLLCLMQTLLFWWAVCLLVVLGIIGSTGFSQQYPGFFLGWRSRIPKNTEAEYIPISKWTKNTLEDWLGSLGSKWAYD